GDARYIEVSAAIEATAPTRAEVELSYHVEGACWQPLYDLALIDDTLTASYLAEVTQQTGEDWPAVQLVLSTSRHGEHRELPELQPWYIPRRQPAAPRRPMRAATLSAAMPEGGAWASSGPGGDKRLDADDVAFKFGDAEPITAEVNESGVSQVY